MRARDKQVGGWVMEAPYNVRSGLVASVVRAALGLGCVGCSYTVWFGHCPVWSYVCIACIAGGFLADFYKVKKLRNFGKNLRAKSMKMKAN